MPLREYIIQSEQSLLSLVLQHYGTLDRLGKFLADNTTTLTERQQKLESPFVYQGDKVVFDTNLLDADARSRNTLRYYQERRHIPAHSPQLTCVDAGIGEMVIEGTSPDCPFIVRAPGIPHVPTPITKAIEFDGINDKGSISSADFTGADFNAVADSLSLSFWIQQLSVPSSFINDAISIAILGSGQDRRISFRLQYYNIPVSFVTADTVGSQAETLVGFGAITSRQLHVIYQRVATGYDIYVDGVKTQFVPTSSFSRTSTTTTNPNSVSVGTNVTDGLGFCNIRVSDFLAIDGQFTPEDITRLYNGGCGDAYYTPLGGPLLWRILFDQPTNPQTDISGNGRDMTMSGFPSPIAPVNGPCP